MSENGEIYAAGKKFTLPPAVTGGTYLTSVSRQKNMLDGSLDLVFFFRSRRIFDFFLSIDQYNQPTGFTINLSLFDELV